MTLCPQNDGRAYIVAPRTHAVLYIYGRTREPPTWESCYIYLEAVGVPWTPRSLRLLRLLTFFHEHATIRCRRPQIGPPSRLWTTKSILCVSTLLFSARCNLRCCANGQQRQLINGSRPDPWKSLKTGLGLPGSPVGVPWAFRGGFRSTSFGGQRQERHNCDKQSLSWATPAGPLGRPEYTKKHKMQNVGVPWAFHNPQK
jgi:hypothetical protein